MSSLVVDLHNHARVVDFLVDAAEYASAKERAPADKMVAQYHDDARIPTEKLAAAARALALATWSARFAVHSFFEGKGAKQELDAVLAAVRPSTAHLIKRALKASGVKTLDALLAHSDADIALQQKEREEIAHIRTQLFVEHWKAHAKTLAPLVQEGENLLKDIRERLDTMRGLAADLPQSLQDELFSKIAVYEDRILYGGEVIPLTILDEEVKYYTEQKAISPIEE